MYKNGIIFLLLLLLNCGNPIFDVNVNNLNDIANFFIISNGITDFAGGYIVKIDNPHDYVSYKHKVLYDAMVYLNNEKMDTVYVDSIQFNSPDLNYFNYLLPDFNTNPGDTNKITIIFPEKADTVVGESIVPHDNEIISINEDDDYFYIKWKEFPGESYEYELQEFFNDEWFSVDQKYVGRSCIAAIAKNRIGNVTKDHIFYLYCYDKNFTNYKVFHQDPSGLSKHFGLFFSQNIMKFKVNFFTKENQKL